jgi:hypothetical protein
MKTGAQPRLGGAPQRDPDVLAAIYRIAIQRYERARAAGVPSTNCDDAAKGFWISEKEKGGKHVEHLTSSPSEVND